MRKRVHPRATALGQWKTIVLSILIQGGCRQVSHHLVGIVWSANAVRVPLPQ